MALWGHSYVASIGTVHDCSRGYFIARSLCVNKGVLFSHGGRKASGLLQGKAWPRLWYCFPEDQTTGRTTIATPLFVGESPPPLPSLRGSEHRSFHRSFHSTPLRLGPAELYLACRFFSPLRWVCVCVKSVSWHRNTLMVTASVIQLTCKSTCQPAIKTEPDIEDIRQIKTPASREALHHPSTSAVQSSPDNLSTCRHILYDRLKGKKLLHCIYRSCIYRFLITTNVTSGSRYKYECCCYINIVT